MYFNHFHTLLCSFVSRSTLATFAAATENDIHIIGPAAAEGFSAGQIVAGVTRRLCGLTSASRSINRHQPNIYMYTQKPAAIPTLDRIAIRRPQFCTVPPRM